MAKKSKNSTPPAPAASTKKRYDEQEETEPFQLSLFSVLDTNKDSYSQTISYDLIPKNFYGKPVRIGERFLDTIERVFMMNNKQYRLKMTPARITDQITGQGMDAFPGKREEIIEDALRKMAASNQRGKAVLLDDQFTVVFSRKALLDELAEQGHKYSYQQIEEAIEILFKTSIEMQSDDGENIAAFHPIESYGFKGRDGESQTYVKFNPLVTESIQNNAFRLINYKKIMSYSSVIARKLHKRMANNFTQAAEGQIYHISLSTIFRDFGLNEKQLVPNKVVYCREAFEELKEANVIKSFSEKPVLNSLKKNKIDDYVFDLVPHEDFINEVVTANKDMVRRSNAKNIHDKFPDIHKRLK